MAERPMPFDFQSMIHMLQNLDERFAAYDQRMEEIERMRREQEREANSVFSNKSKQLESAAEKEQKEARERSSAWNRKADACLETAKRIRAQVAQAMSAAAQYGSPAPLELEENDSVDLLRQEQTHLKSLKISDDVQKILGMYDGSCTLYTRIEQQASAMRKAALQQCNDEISRCLQKYEQERAQAANLRDEQRESCREQEKTRIERAQQNLVETVREEVQPQVQAKQYAALNQMMADYDTFQPAKELPQGFELGYAVYDTSAQEKDLVKREILNKQFSFAKNDSDSAQELVVHYGYRFTDEKVSTLFEYDASNRQKIVEILRGLVMQLLMRIPCGKVRFTFIDPLDRGTTFAIFSRLGEIDERIIDTHIWSNEDRIEERLQAIVDHTEDVIQRCLQGRYRDIIEYNASAGKNAEPLRFLIVMDFPRHFTKRALDSLESIINKGPQNGVFTILAGDVSELDSPSCPPELAKIFGQMHRISTKQGVLYTDYMVGDNLLQYRPLPGSDGEKAQSVIDTLRRGIQEAERIVVTYDEVSEDLLNRPDYWFHYDARNGICVPIGLEGANKPVLLQLGGVNRGGKKRPFHAMVAGNIGAGKSNMLHTIIMSTLLHYNAEDVQLYLLDFKRGIEFKCYADAKLANFRTIAIDTEPEFGLAVLQELEKEVKHRSARFREENVDRIEAYRERMAQRGVVHHGMPRIMVIFDEYQELFHDAEDPIVRECARLLTQVVLLAGSAMGIHIILATQDVCNVHGLDTSLYAQFETRIALKCDEAACKTILSPDNEASRVLVTADSGQAVFNDAIGHKDYNHIFRGAFIEREERFRLLKEIHDRQQMMPDLQTPETRLLLSGVQDDASNVLNRFCADMQVEDSLDPANHLYIGQSLSMVNNFHLELWNRAGHNLLLIGRSQAKARQICAFSAMSLLYETIRQQQVIDRPVITVFDFVGSLGADVGGTDLFGNIYGALPEAFRVFDRDDVIRGLQILQEELAAGERHFVIFFGLNRARRLMMSSSYYDRLPRDILVDLLRRGPENGMNFIVWANDPALYLENYSDTLDLFEHRIGFNMDPPEYAATINHVVRQSKDSVPREEGELNAISFNINDENQKIRFYGMPTKEWMNRFIENCKAYIQ